MYLDALDHGSAGHLVDKTPLTVNAPSGLLRGHMTPFSPEREGESAHLCHLA